MKTYVLRLTPKDVRDVAVVEAQPSADVVTEGEQIDFRAKIRTVGPSANAPVAELWIDGVPKDKKQVEIPANGETEVRFVPQKADAAASPPPGQVVVISVVRPTRRTSTTSVTSRSGSSRRPTS